MSKLDKRFIFDSDRVDGKDYTDFFNDFVQQGDYPYSRVGENDVFSVNCGVNFPANVFENGSMIKYLEYKDGAFVLCMGIDIGEEKRSLVALKIDKDNDVIKDSFTVLEEELKFLQNVSHHCWFYSTVNDVEGNKYWIRLTKGTAQYQLHEKIDVTSIVNTYNITCMMYYPEIDRFLASSVDYTNKTVTHYLFDRAFNLITSLQTFSADINIDFQGNKYAIYHTSRPTLEYYRYDRTLNIIEVKNLVGVYVLTDPGVYGIFVDKLEVTQNSITAPNSTQVVTYNSNVSGVYYSSTSYATYYRSRISFSPYKDGTIVIVKTSGNPKLYYGLSSYTMDDWWNQDFIYYNDTSLIFSAFLSSDNSLFSKTIYNGAILQNFSTKETYVVLYSSNKDSNYYILTDISTARGESLNTVYTLTKNLSNIYPTYRVSGGQIVSANYTYAHLTNDIYYFEIYYDTNIPSNLINETPDLTLKISNFSTSVIKSQIDTDIANLFTTLAVSYPDIEYSLRTFVYDNNLLVVDVQGINLSTGEYSQFVLEYTFTYDSVTGEITSITNISGFQTVSLTFVPASTYYTFDFYTGSLVLYDVDTNVTHKIYFPGKYINVSGTSLRRGVYADDLEYRGQIFSDARWLAMSVFIVEENGQYTLTTTSPYYSSYIPWGSKIHLFCREKTSISPTDLFTFTYVLDVYRMDSSFTLTNIRARCVSNTSSILFLDENYVIINGVKYDNISLTYDLDALQNLDLVDVIGYLYLEYDVTKEPMLYIAGYTDIQQENLTRIKIAEVDKIGQIYVSKAEPKKSVLADKPIQIYGNTSIIPVTDSQGKLTTDTQTGPWTTSYRNIVEKSGDVFYGQDVNNLIRVSCLLQNDAMYEFIIEWVEDIGIDNYLYIPTITAERQYGMVVSFGDVISTRQISYTTPDVLKIHDDAKTQPRYISGFIWLKGDRSHIKATWKRDNVFSIYEGEAYNLTFSNSLDNFVIRNVANGDVTITYKVLLRRVR